MTKNIEKLFDVPVESVALRRIIEEVRDNRVGPTRYNRTYHRHNRS